MALQSRKDGLFCYVYFFERRQSLLITTSHRIISAPSSSPNIIVSHPPSHDPPLSIYWHIIQPHLPDILRSGEGLRSCSVLKSVCHLIHRKLLEI